MRLKLLLQVMEPDSCCEIPINYQYEMMSAVYSILETADKQYAEKLHQDGYQTEYKRFKLFCFSNLIAPNKGIVFNKNSGRLKINGKSVYWQISFMLEDGMQSFLKGLFANQTIRIADKIGGVTFQVAEVQIMSEPQWSPNGVECRAISPICVTQKVKDKQTAAYLSPESNGYEDALLAGLLERYKAIHNRTFDGDKYCRLSVIGGLSKSKLIKIKADTKQQTQVRGFVYKFKIELPEELFIIAYNSGMGEKCSMGFGMIEML